MRVVGNKRLGRSIMAAPVRGSKPGFHHWVTSLRDINTRRGDESGSTPMQGYGAFC